MFMAYRNRDIAKTLPNLENGGWAVPDLGWAARSVALSAVPKNRMRPHLLAVPCGFLGPLEKTA